MTLALEASHLTRRYEKIVALNDVSASGEVVGVVGPNGSGKTTLLRCITGLLRADGGAARINGHDVVSEHESAVAGLAFIPEIPTPFLSLTPWEHLLFNARAFGLAPGWEARATEVMGQLGMLEYRDRLCSELSKGQRQKVHLAMAMAREPTALVLDEPLIGLDPRGMRALKDWVKSRSAAGAGALVSSHALTFVEELCSRVLVLDHGRMVAAGTVDQLRATAHAPATADLEDVFLAITGPLTPNGPG